MQSQNNKVRSSSNRTSFCHNSKLKSVLLPTIMWKFNLPTKKFYFKTEAVSTADMFQTTVKFANFIGRSIGVNILDTDFSNWNLLLLFNYFDMVTYFMISFENIYSFRDELERQVFCVVTLGMGFQVAVKLYTFIFKRSEILELISMTKNFCGSSNDVRAKQCSEKWILISCHLGAFVGFLFFGCALLMFSYPFIYYGIMGEKILHFGFVIPGTDWKSPQGYTINFFHHTYQIFAVIMGLYGSVVITLILILQAFAQYDSLKIMLDDLNAFAVNNLDGRQNRIIKICIGRITDEHVKLLE